VCLFPLVNGALFVQNKLGLELELGLVILAYLPLDLRMSLIVSEAHCRYAGALIGYILYYLLPHGCINLFVFDCHNRMDFICG